MQVDPGKLRHKIEIYDYNCTLIHSCYASINQISGTEAIKSNVQFEQATTRFLMRYPKVAIPSDGTIQYNGYNYDIKYTNDYNEEHKYIEVLAIKREWDVYQ